MKKLSPDEIDQRISTDLRQQKAAQERIERERVWAQSKMDELWKQYGCDHRQAENERRCEKCGYAWSN